MAAVTICSDFGAQENKVSHCFHCFPMYFKINWTKRSYWNIIYSSTFYWGAVISLCWGTQWKWKSFSHVHLFVSPWITVHGILQTRILEWVAFPSCRGSSQPRDGTQASRIAGGFGGFFTSWATREKGLRCGMLSFYRLMNGWIILFQARGVDFQGLDHRAPFGLLGWLQTGGCVIPYANTLQWAYNRGSGSTGSRIFFHLGSS